MKILLFLLGVFLVPGIAIALERITDSRLRESITQNIRLNGYACNACTDAYVIGEDYRGFVYRIICNNNLLAFTVILTPSGKFIVKPW